MSDTAASRTIKHVDEQGATVAEAVARVPAHELLTAAVDALLAQDAVDLPGAVALERLRSVLADVSRVQVAVLAGIVDMDRRELFALDSAGGTRSWLRRLPGGEDGQLGRARELAGHPGVEAAVAAGVVSPRSAHRLCAALDAVPPDLGEEVTVGLLRDGVAPLLVEATGGVPLGADADTEARVLAQQVEDADVIAGCVADRLAGPPERVAPALLLLAQRVGPGVLPHVLRRLLDGVREEGPEPDAMRYFVRLRALWDGDWDLRGVLDPETGALLAEQLDARATPRPGDSPPDATEATGELDLGLAPSATRSRTVIAPTPVIDADPVCVDPGHSGGPGTSARDCAGCGPADLPPAVTAHHTLRELLRRHRTRADGRIPAAVPTALTVVATLASSCGVPGAPPALLHRRGAPPVPIPASTAARLGCDSELAAVLLSAAGTPVGASHTARSATPAQRRALRAAWGPHCAVRGCTATATVPHHVIPFHLSHETVLRDLAPLCDSCHHDIHEGRRVVQLRDGRLIDDTGWAAPTQTRAA